MSDHIEPWLGAYLDGELSPRRRRQVEAHLKECHDCQSAYHNLRALSDILQDYPAAPSVQEERFVANVLLKLPRRSEHKLSPSAVWLGWQFAPLVLLVAYAFLQSVLFVSGALFVIAQLFPELGYLSGLLPSMSGFTMSMDSLGLQSVVGILFEARWVFPLFHLLVTLIVGLFACGWMASYLAGRRHLFANEED